MRTRQVLVAVSGVQLAAGVAGHVVAVRGGRPFDIAVLGWRGRPERVARDSWLIGTGLSAPVIMLAAQAWGVARLAPGPSDAAARTLGRLGAAMVVGYLVEKEVRRSVSPDGWNPVTTPIVSVGLTLAVAMAVMGLRRGSEA